MNKPFSLRVWLASLGLLCTLFGTVLLRAEQPAALDHRQVTHYVASSGEIAPIKTVADWQQRKAEIFQNMQQVMGALPEISKQERELKFEVLETAQGDGYTRQKISFAAEPGAPVVADLYLPTGLTAGEKRAAVVALHPTGPLGKRIIAGEGPLQNRQYGLELAQRGYVVICPDYPSFGDLKDYDFANDDYVSGTMKGIVNHRRSVDLLRSLEQVDGERIGVIGHSLGGHNALFLAAFDERVKAVISSCGWTPFHDYKGGDLTGWTSERYMPRIRTEYDKNPDKVPFDFPEIIAALAPRPFFSSSPVSDDNFDVAGVRKGMAAAQKIYDLHQVPDNLQLVEPLCEHDFPTEIRSDAYQFLDQALKHKPQRELSFAGELPRLPAVPPEKALDTLQIAPGFRVDLVAHEPLVVDPVAMCFDENGGLYVVEMRGYSEDSGENLDEIRYLEDVDQDGVFDKCTIFASGLSWPTAVICYDGGVFIGAAPDIYYFKDTDGDGVADVKEVVYTGFGNKNVQALLNSFRWGLDNRIYGATSSNGGIVKRPGEPDSAAINLHGRNFSFNPVTLELRPESGSAQHGLAFDDWGRLFVCSNSDHFQMVTYADRYAARNSFLKAPPARLSVADDGPQAVVYRVSPVEPWRIVRTRLRASGRVKGAVEHGGKNSGYFTSATGVNFFRGDSWNPAQKGTAVIGDVGSNLVHRKEVIENGVLVRGRRIDDMSELVASTDTWFRPVQYENGPEGGMYLLDMYRETIEHPWSLPPEIKEHLDLTSGRDKGRLYRLVPEGYQYRPTPQLGKASPSTLVELLNHPNAWHRETASRLLYQAQDQAAVAELVQRYPTFSDLGKMHALYVLNGLGKLPAELVLSALKSENPQLRRHALILSEHFTADKTIQQQLAVMVSDPSPVVRYQLAFSLGEFPADWNAPLLARILIQDAGSSWIQFAALSSVSNQLPGILREMAANEAFLKSSPAVKVLSSLTELIARRAEPAEVESFAQTLLENGLLSQQNKQELYRTFAINVSRRGTAFPALEGWKKNFLTEARQAATDTGRDLKERIAAIQSLAVSQSEQDTSLLLDLLDQREPEAIQTAALNTLVTLDAAGTDAFLLQSWAKLGPALRKQAQQALFSRPAWTVSLLTAVLNDQFPRADVDRAQLQVLLNSKSPEIASLSRQVIERLQDSPRAAVIEKFRPALDADGNMELGRTLFTKHCSSCHLMEGKGKPIGPNLASFKNRGKEALLINILDPSREVTPEYLNYLVVMEDGRTYTGLLASQSATTISLQRAEGEPITLLRAEIEEMRSSGISLMPEGLEKDLNLSDMTDLLHYLMNAE